MPVKYYWVDGTRRLRFEKEKEGEIKVGIDTNIFLKLFESAESLNAFKDKGYTIYTHQRCVNEMRKKVKELDLKDKNTEMVVDRFMEKNGILLTYEEVDENERMAFEKKCQKAGIACHYPDSEIILAFKQERIQKVYSQDINFRKSAEIAGMKAEKFHFFDNIK